MLYRVLGALEVEIGPAPARLAGRNARTLLAALLTTPNRPVSVDRLADAIWPGTPPKTFHKNLQMLIHQLRQLLGADRIVRHPHGYSIVVGTGELDATVFRELVATAAGSSEPAQRRALLAEALDWWRGPVLADLAEAATFREFVVALTEQRLAAIEDRLDADLALGDHHRIAAEVAALVAEHPLRERLRGQHMITLYRCGRLAEALTSFQDIRTILADELGVEPGEALARLHLGMLRGDGDLTLAGALPVPRELPRAVADFVGRDDTFKEMDTALADRSEDATSIVALTGVGGVGKTAAAVRWAQRNAHLFPDGQLYLNLAGYSDDEPVRPAAALGTLLQTLGAAPEQIPAELSAAAARFRTMTSGRRLLLLLDNARSAEQVRPLLPAGPGALVLVTSRDRLNSLVAFDGASRLIVDLLSEQESTDLLAAMIGRQRLAREPAAARALAALGGGLPLALRIMAARLADRPHRTIAQEVAEHHGFAIDGHDAVQAAFDRSYRDLPPTAQAAFRCLGLVALPTFSAAEVAMLADIPTDDAERCLAQLAAAHLIEPGDADRFEAHQLLRGYAAALGRKIDGGPTGPAGTAAIERLFAWQVATTTAAVEALNRPSDPAADHLFAGPAAALAWLDANRESLAATVLHAARFGPYPIAWQVPHLLLDYQDLYHHSVDRSGQARAAVAAARVHGDIRAQASAYQALAHACFGPSNNARAVTYLRKAASLARTAGWRQQEAAIVREYALMLFLNGELPAAGVQAALAQRMSEEIDDLAGALDAMRMAVEIHAQQGTPQEGLQLARAAYDAAGPDRVALRGRLIGSQATLHRMLGDLDSARDCAAASLAASRRLHDPINECVNLLRLAEIAIDAGDAAAAGEHAGAATLIADQLVNPWLQADSRLALGEAALLRPDPAAAVGRFTAALSYAEAVKCRHAVVSAWIGLAAAHQALGDRSTAVSYAERALPISQAAGFGPLTTRAGDLLDNPPAQRSPRDSSAP